MAIERILQTDSGKVAFEKTDLNMVNLDAFTSAMAQEAVMYKPQDPSYDQTKLYTWTKNGVYLTPVSGIVDLPSGWAQGRHVIVVFSPKNDLYAIQIIATYPGNSGLGGNRRVAIRHAITEGSEWVELTTSCILPPSQDFNTLTSSGLYYLGSYPTNAPLASGQWYCHVLALQDKVNITQIAYRRTNTVSAFDMYIRSCFNGVWSDWYGPSTKIPIALTPKAGFKINANHSYIVGNTVYIDALVTKTDNTAFGTSQAAPFDIPTSLKRNSAIGISASPWYGSSMRRDNSNACIFGLTCYFTTDSTDANTMLLWGSYTI